jgi:hypothetical protein
VSSYLCDFVDVTYFRAAASAAVPLPYIQTRVTRRPVRVAARASAPLPGRSGFSAPLKVRLSRTTTSCRVNYISSDISHHSLCVYWIYDAVSDHFWLTHTALWFAEFRASAQQRSDAVHRRRHHHDRRQ